MLVGVLHRGARYARGLWTSHTESQGPHTFAANVSIGCLWAAEVLPPDTFVDTENVRHLQESGEQEMIWPLPAGEQEADSIGQEGLVSLMEYSRYQMCQLCIPGVD